MLATNVPTSPAPVSPPSAAPFTLRDFAPPDAPFVYSSWLHAYRPYAPPVPRATYFKEQHRLISALIGAPGGVRRVAAFRDGPEQIFGYVFGAVGRLDYVFVKPIYRHFGIARALLAELGPVRAYTHAGPLVPDGAEFNPYLLYYLPAPD